MSRVILGIDPGLTRCGVGIVRSIPGRKVELVHVETIATPPEMELSERIGFIADHLEALLVTHQPEAVAIERVFAQANLSSVMGVAQISGVALYLARKHQIEVHMHTPSEVKAAVTGSGRAQKAQIGSAVAKILGLADIPKPADSADALAIAICNAWKGFSADPARRVVTSAQEAWVKAERVATRRPRR